MDAQTFQNIILLLSLTPIALLVVIAFLFFDRKKLKMEISSLNNEKNKTTDMFKFYVGAKALINDYALSHKASKTSFKVDYEVEIVEVSDKQIKVNAVSFTSNDDFGRDPNNKQSIIRFLQGHWVDKKSAELIIDDSHYRHKKLEELGI